MEYLDRALIVTMQAELIDRYGGSYGIRDENLLASAIARPEMPAHYEPEAGIARQAATLAWGLLKNHAFIDGNKRIGFMAMVVFLELNGYQLDCTEAEETVVVLHAAASEIDEAEWNAWVERTAKPLG